MKRYTLLIIFIFFTILPLWCRDDLGMQQVRIAGISYVIGENSERRAGITREPALRRYYQLSVGDIYSSAEELERTLDNITRKLNSQKIFQEINWEVSYWREDFPLLSRENLGAYITITVKDTLSLYLLPTVMYDSNLGMVYGGSFNYDNVLGTLTNLSLRGYGGTSTWRVGGTWERVPLELFRGDFSLFCEQVRTQRVDDQDRTVLEYTNLLLDFNVRIDVPLDYGWSISIQPGAYLPFNYELVSWDPGYGRDEFDNLTPQTTGFLKWGGAYSNVYWEENFRRGIGGDVSLTWEGFLDEWKFEKSLDCSFSTFYRPLPFLGLGHHFSAFYVFDGIRDEAGLYIRGVLDHLMYGEWGLFLNNNVDIRAFAIPPVVELHCYPLFDLGVVYDSSTPFDAYDYRLTAGFGITLFPLFLQSLQMNVEVGWDTLNEGESEISIKSELFF